MSNESEHKEIVREFLKKSQWVIGQTENIKDVYELGDQIGEHGTYGYAVNAKHKTTEEIRAVKILPKEDWTKEDINNVRKEIKVLKSVEHVNIIKVFEVFEDSDNVYILMELCSGGELFEKMQKNGKFSEKQAAQMIKQVIEGVVHLHKLSIVHCDLKPDNFLFLEVDKLAPLKIIDMGMAQKIKPGGYLSEVIGTPFYIAPEVLKGAYNEKCDVFSIGIILFMLVFGFPPYPCQDIDSPDMVTEREDHFVNEVKDGKGPFFPSGAVVSEDLKDFITKTLLYTYTDRPSPEELLKHSWFVLQENAPDEKTDEVKQEEVKKEKEAPAKVKTKKSNKGRRKSERPKSRVDLNEEDKAKKKGTLGFKMSDVYDEKEGGMMVVEVVKGMPAEQAGLTTGDIVVRVNGCEIKDLAGFRGICKNLKPGKPFSLNVKRSGQVTRLQVELPE